jgi:coenzyme F420-0:L-glutamate ligase/coenzyme F420-1:gamma-L-glutamate ligase
MQATWKSDLAAEGWTTEEIDMRVSRGNILRTAPTVIFPFVDLAAGAHTYPNIDGNNGGHNNDSERIMFHIAGGAAIENMLISIAADNFGSAWISSSIFCPTTMRRVLDLPDTYWPLGAIAVGQPTAPARERPEIDVQSLLIRGKSNG